MPTTSSTHSEEAQYGLPRDRRLLSRRDFRLVYGKGLRAGGKYMVVVAHRRHSPGHRLGLSVSKANGCAVRRNKIKRLLREAFRLQQKELAGSFDMILIPRPRSEKLSLPLLQKELSYLTQKIAKGGGKRRTVSPKK